MSAVARTRALVCRRFGPLRDLSFERIPIAPPGPGELRIRVQYVGLNFPDVLLVRGAYQERPPFPFTPGGELSGIVTDVGAGVDVCWRGERVMAITFRGALAEEINVCADRVRRVPPTMSMETAAAFQGVYFTAYYALVLRGCLQSGETLLVLGSSGGVGSAAVQIGRALGATVIGAAGSAEKAEFALAQGAHHAIDYASQSLRDRVRELTDGRGADVVLDPVGGKVFDEAVRAVAWNGRYLVVGFAAGIGSLPANLPLLKGYSLVGVYYGRFREFEPVAAQEAARATEALYEKGLIAPHIGATYPFESAVAALEHLARGDARGKIVVKR